MSQKKTNPPATATLFKQYLQDCQQRVQAALEQALPEAEEPAQTLKSAIRYSVLNGGKRVRATLVYAAAECVDTDFDSPALDAAACAVEMIHAYSLIHDDLPAMDDDDLRRGQPTCHIAYDEATAILAGDALQTLAYQQILNTDLESNLKSRLLHSLLQASGYEGMVGGQALDLAAENRQLNLSQLEQVHRLKTGALINSCVEMGALLAGANEQQLDRLKVYASAIGLAFQVKDDILDVEGSTEELGKPQGTDQAHQKSTYPALIGLTAAKTKLQQLLQQAMDSIKGFGECARPLQELATFIVARNH